MGMWSLSMQPNSIQFFKSSAGSARECQSARGSRPAIEKNPQATFQKQKATKKRSTSHFFTNRSIKKKTTSGHHMEMLERQHKSASEKQHYHFSISISIA